MTAKKRIIIFISLVAAVAVAVIGLSARQLLEMVLQY
mgnify:CR=1 FL=1